MEVAKKIPNHVAIILDGNGRWAQERGLKRSAGHQAGARNLKKLVNHIFDLGISVLSIYAFSTENFKRSQEEVDYLMNLFVKEFEKNYKTYRDKNIKVVFSGRKEPLNEEILSRMDKVMTDTSSHTGGIFNICLNYGGRSEIVDATKKIVAAISDGSLSLESLNETTFEQYLYHDLPPIDFMIRTSGESRISNFMLWQISYAELYFPKTYFPDFVPDKFDQALVEYTARDRRFGGVDNEKKSH